MEFSVAEESMIAISEGLETVQSSNINTCMTVFSSLGISQNPPNKNWMDITQVYHKKM